MIDWKDRKVVSVLVLDCAKQKRREGGGVCPSPDFFLFLFLFLCVLTSLSCSSFALHPSDLSSST